MQDFLQYFLQFVLQNWLLCSLFLLILIVLLWFETRTTVGGVTKLDPQMLVQLINRESATVIDIRDVNAYKQGHIVGSVNIPLAQLADKNKKLQKFKGKPIAMVCAAGQSAMKAAQELKKQEFEKVYCLKGGIAAWKNAGLPIEKV